jgi:hypothetical protein
VAALLFTRSFSSRHGGCYSRLFVSVQHSPTTCVFSLPLKKSSVTRGACIDAAFALDEPVKWLGLVLDRGRVPHNPRPFASGSHVHSSRVGGAPDDGSERVFPLGHVEQRYSASRMPHTFKMKNRDPAVRRPPQRRCIYCDATSYRLKSDRKLGDEHVIAEGLGGNLVLQEASCEACETAIMGFEPAVLRTILYAPRVHLGIRRKRRKRGEEAIKVRGSLDGDEVEIDLPIKNVPVLLFLLRLGLPGILIGRPPESSSASTTNPWRFSVSALPT